MTTESGDPGRRISLFIYLIGFIALIVGIVVISSLVISYWDAKAEIEYDYAILQNYTDSQIAESAGLVNKGLELVDDSLNPVMKESLLVFSNAYSDGGNEPSQMNLTALKSAFSKNISGTVNLYVIDADGIIRYSTLPDVIGVDFRNYPDFYASLTRVRLGSGFAADHVVRSVLNASDPGVRGTLRKFAYLPSPDHRYVLEIGVDSPEIKVARSELSYQSMVQRLRANNPDIRGIRVYDFYVNLVAQNGTVVAGGKEYVAAAIRNRTGFFLTDPERGTETRYLFVDLRDPDALTDNSIVVELDYSQERRDRALNDLLSAYILIGLCAIAIGIVLAVFLFRRITGGVREIVADVEQVAGGDLDHAIRAVDIAEFARLESSINTMIHTIRTSSEELEHKRTELKVAADIQEAFLPVKIESPAGFDIAAGSWPAREVGGDFFDIFPAGNGKYVIAIADVAGKGVPASLFMALSRTILRIVSRWAGTVREIVSSSNTIFIEDSGSVSFVTVFYAILDGTSRSLAYVNAGHNPPVIRRAGGLLEELAPTGPVIGLLPTARYEERSVILQPGDALILYTDGVTEAMNEAEEMYSEERLGRVIAESAGLPAAQIVDEIRSAVESFRGDAPQSDDITTVVVRAL